MTSVIYTNAKGRRLGCMLWHPKYMSCGCWEYEGKVARLVCSPWLVLPAVVTVGGNTGIGEWLVLPYWFLHMLLFISCWDVQGAVNRHDAALYSDTQDSYGLIAPVPVAVCALLLASCNFWYQGCLAETAKMEAAILLSPAQHFSGFAAALSRQTTYSQGCLWATNCRSAWPRKAVQKWGLHLCALSGVTVAPEGPWL